MLIVVNVPLTTRSLATVNELPIVTLPSTVKSWPTLKFLLADLIFVILSVSNATNSNTSPFTGGYDKAKLIVDPSDAV